MGTNFTGQQDNLLTNVSSGFKAPGCVAERVLPEVRSAMYAGSIEAFGNENLRIENSVKGGRGKYRRVEFAASGTKTFLIKGHGLEGMVTKEDFKKKRQPFDAEAEETESVSNLLLLEKEFILASALRNPAIVTQNVTLAGTSKWSNRAKTGEVSDPIGNIVTMRSAMINSVGAKPNKVIMDLLVHETIKYHPAFLAELGYTNVRPGGLTDQELAQILGVEEVLIPDARYNSAKQGKPKNMVSIWGKDMIFINAPNTAAKYQQSAGYRFVPDDSKVRKTYKWDVQNPPGSRAILVEDEYDQQISDVGCIYLIKDVI